MATSHLLVIVTLPFFWALVKFLYEVLALPCERKLVTVQLRIELLQNDDPGKPSALASTHGPAHVGIIMP